MTRVLLVDDQMLIRAGFRTILESEPGLEVVGEAANGADALDLAARLDPDVICMDVQMPVMDGIAATRELVARRCRAAVLILTTFDRDDFLFETLDAGASGFLLKTAEAEKLIEAVQVLGRGDALLMPEVTRRVLIRYAGAPPVGAGAQADLTEREVDTLRCLARGLTNAEIAAELYVSTETVKTHVSNILAKLGLRDRVAAVIWAFRHGVAT
ncbi:MULTISPECIES: response regulator transcription factor [unclassified Actinomyces]|uniref:response regulator n=1 Tax=unclassified Actinomyces TaxID=2609248 RepID=UPI002016C41D|nr:MULTISPECIES: response regulator transcription factor [unclassified Actinomyces]MCL3778676.1 response regulator transcription factor [Actinomyces sp. AC-20-1]MCL3790119.1 response regulator transcription factor [Actinomyces sp. 187325]MCL3791215.1 response regulator transcription factor [Actinomyces sp. 186855]MCL3794482.1 response regulator transcription factor [Actinomyces sp. 217892]